jgi:hypothetical protein
LLTFSCAPSPSLPDGNFEEAAKLYEAEGEYTSAAKFYLKGGLPVKSARLIMKIARTEILDGFFLPSATTSAESAVALKDAVSSVTNADTSLTVTPTATASVSVSVTVSNGDKAAITLERKILKNHKSFSAETEKYEKLRAEIQESSDSHRQLLTAMRCLIRNMEALMPVKKRESEQTASYAAPALDDSLLDVLSSAVGDLYESCQVFQDALSTLHQTLNSTQPTAPSPSICDALRQCEEMFECTRGFTGLGSFKYLVADIPAAVALYCSKTEAAPPKRSRNTASTVSVRTLPTHASPVKKRIEITAKVFAERSSEFLSSLLVHPIRLLIDQLTLQLCRKHSPHNNRYEMFLGALNRPSTFNRSETGVRVARLHHAWQRSSIIASSDADFASVVSRYFIYEYYPPLPLVEDMQALALMRGSRGMQEYRYREFEKMKTTNPTSFEAVAARLLLIDSIDAFGTKEKLALYTDLSKHDLNNSNRALYHAFKNEMVSVTQNLNECDDPSHIRGHRQEDMFSMAMEAGHAYLIKPWSAGNPLDVNSKQCITVTTFLTLVERYTVLSLLYQRQCEGVCLPVSLLMNVMCRKNAAYANMIKCCATARRDSRDLRSLLYGILDLLMRILASSVMDLHRWESASKKQDEEKFNPATAVTRISYLIVTIITNNPSFGLPRLAINRHLLDGLPKVLNIRMATLAHSRPNVQSHASLCEALKDTLVCVTLSDMAHSAHTDEMKKLGRAILTTKGETVLIAIKPPPPKVPPTSPLLTPSTATGVRRGAKQWSEGEFGWHIRNQKPSIVASDFISGTDTDNAGDELSFDHLSAVMDFTPTPELGALGSTDQPLPLPAQSKVSLYDKCCVTLTARLSEARERLKTLTPADRLERDLERSFRDVSRPFLLNAVSRAGLNSIVKLYVSSLLEKLLAVRECVAVIERLGRSSEDAQVTSYLTSHLLYSLIALRGCDVYCSIKIY